ncbi:MAG: aspartate aminotransferase family protein [Armatimonadetes bacterium]|nr:MAG: aspartate aminotransferase family protein [Armatimonadota bacterium]
MSKRLDDTVDRYTRYLNPGLARLMTFAGFGLEARAEGVYVYDDDGNAYLDCLGGYGVFALGHRHPKVVEAAKRALDQIPLSSKVFFNEPQGLLAEKLAELTPGNLQFSFFVSSGTEAVEAALKFARHYRGRPVFVAAHNGYHGKTFGSVSVTGREKYRTPFEPLLPTAKFVPFGDVDALAEAADEQTAAIILEPIQGEGGIRLAPPGYLTAAKEIAQKVGALLILDEVQTGLGRTGRNFAAEYDGVTPDLMTLAKALGGGVCPIGALIGTEEVWQAVLGENPLLHTSTFGGNQLACSCALAALEVLVQEDLATRAEERGKQLLAGLRQVQAQHSDLLAEVRGVGLMVGVEFSMDEVAELCIAHMLKRGVIAAYTLNNPRVIRFEPPLIISEEEVDRAINVFGEAVAETQELLGALQLGGNA